jgi:hypothetical protein
MLAQLGAVPGVTAYIPHICKRISPEFPAGWLDQR